MKRPARIALYTLCFLSLILCIATVAVWIRSYWVTSIYFSDTTQMLTDHGLRRYRTCAASRGLISIFYRERIIGNIGFAQSLADNPDYQFANEPASPDEDIFGTDEKSIMNHLGFLYFSDPSFIRLIFPLWAPTLAFAIAPATLLLKTLKQSRLRRAGHCPTCGYDLRATPHRCPECGQTTTT